MDWLHLIRQHEPNQRNLLKIFGAYKRSINTVDNNWEGIQWLYRASKNTPHNMSHRWERFCDTILIVYQCHGGTEFHTNNQNSQRNQHQNHDADLLAKILELETNLRQKETMLHQLQHTVQSKSQEINTLKKRALEETQIKLLLRICHPDRNTHSRSEEVTRWLLEMLAMK